MFRVRAYRVTAFDLATRRVHDRNDGTTCDDESPLRTGLDRNLPDGPCSGFEIGIVKVPIFRKMPKIGPESGV